MRYGFIVTTGDPRTVADLASEAEAAGWDGVFTWDGIAVGDGDIYDPWVVMAAIAMRTSRVRIGAIVTPPSRRRPWKLARETMSLDRLSDGRLILPVGLGALEDDGFGKVGEATEARLRAERLDESLAILDGLWSGRPFGFEGRHYRFDPMTFRPAPIQRPRIPIWVVGAWPRERSMRRAIRWDGVLVQGYDADGRPVDAVPDTIAAVADYVARERPAGPRAHPFDIVAQGATPTDERAAARALVAPFEEAGATWWIEADWANPDVAAMRARIAAGPPRDPSAGNT